MKLPTVDKFLQNLYNSLRETDKSCDLFDNNFQREIWCSKLDKLREKYRKKEERKRISHLIYYSKRKGYIKIKKIEQKEAFLLTKKGMEKILKTELKSKEKKTRTDKKWQMVIFDIPEKEHILRDLFREDLQILGYEMLQQSVWLCPYDVLKETEAVIRRYALDSCVKLFLVKEMEI